MKLLALDTSILGDNSISRQLMGHFLNQWQQRHGKAEVVYRDLDQQTINHLSSHIVNAKQQSLLTLSEPLKEELQLSETLITEFLSADEVVIGVPMYNFSIPTQLKAWIDRIVVAGRTFKYTEQGVVGLAAGKQLTIISTRGNHYNNASMRSLDHQEEYLKTIFNFLGITDLTIIRAEGLHRGDAIREKAIALAMQKIKDHFLVAA
ncbi:FMN-dependent NADH-azoreductase [Legionella hackeliae]|uniref:FMN dependent NADH:quinone oxidoreductase n=1 Tax=Legionella hackeliae TaxID=449 RepID=A0A0A8UP55_LEGHA|nr:NAD(P)H-dependent oxidoreductase [Legionella hackeliae]KTD13468.1 ACP phosphodiesterase [Legionella hackeliae]CEK09311.1 FMN-dependent NADH-azoreductase [Legionella hackeliae]STX49216.1 ACP phosphodiesterase [Legionella hackeliae]